MSTGSAYRLRLGQVVVELRCPLPGMATALADYFACPSDPATPTVSLELSLVPDKPDQPVPNSLLTTKTLTGAGFDIADGLMSGRYDPATGQGELQVAERLSGGRLTRIFEQIIYQAFHAGCRRAGWDAILVHSAGVIRDGQGYLFVGPSGIGKSTIADLSRDAVVVNDEMNLVAFDAAGPMLLPSPFNGHYRDKRPGQAPLRVILLPRHGDHHQLAAVGSGEAAAEIAAQVAPPVPLDQLPGPDTPAAMLREAIRLSACVPVRRMYFTPDAGFWPVVLDDVSPSLRG